MLCFGNNSSCTGSAFQSPIVKPGKYTGRLACLFKSPFRFVDLLAYLLIQSLVLCQTYDVIHIVSLAPAQNIIPAKTAVCTNDNPYLGPTGS